MYTQCPNCQAIYSVSMREVTVSKGFLRCGECLQVFDSSSSLSTTMQEPFVDVELQNIAKTEKISVESLQNISALDDWQTTPHVEPLTLDRKPVKKKAKTSNESKETPTEKANPFSTKGTEKPAFEAVNDSKDKFKSKWPIIVAALLALLLVVQVLLNFNTLFGTSPKYEPEKIQMLTHNVFAHPIDKDVLLISASIENIATFDQAFPVLEVRLTDSKSELVALRRFTPDEYLDNYSKKKLLTKNRPTSIKLKIKDPGNQATRFEFDFL